MNRSEFERDISQLTQPLNGQFPRPWMTTIEDPLEAEVFIVGRNQAKGYPMEMAGGHKRYLDSLFNRNGQTCRGLYDEITGVSPSPTRKNTDWSVGILRRKGVSKILETNVICYSSPMSADLRLNVHIGGAARGQEIFQFLFDSIKPKALVVHGAGAIADLRQTLQLPSLQQPKSEMEYCHCYTGDCLVVAIPSLSPPPFNAWKVWSEQYIEMVADKIVDHIGQFGEPGGG